MDTVSGRRMGGMERLLPLFGVDPEQKRPFRLERGWKCYNVKRPDGRDAPAQVILIASGPKNMAAVKKAIGSDRCVVLFVPKRMLYLKALDKSLTVQLDGEGEFERVTRTLSTCNITGTDKGRYLTGLLDAIDKIPKSSAYFDNRGVFSNHYLRNRLWDDLRRDIAPEAKVAGAAIGRGAWATLEALGWNLGSSRKDGAAHRIGHTSIVVVPMARNLSVMTGGKVAPPPPATQSQQS